MAEKATEKVGTEVKAKHVVRPDGTELTVSGGTYVLDVEGSHVIDGKEITVR